MQQHLPVADHRIVAAYLRCGYRGRGFGRSFDTDAGTADTDASVFSFDLVSTGDPEADFAAVETFISRLRVLRLVANIGDARSLVAHPASMTHSHMTPQQLADAGIAWTTVRLSIGLEDADDLIADLDQALAAA